MARYTCRRLSQLESPEDDRPHAVSLATPQPGQGVEIQHVILGPSGKVPIEIHDDREARILTLAGRGAATIEGERVELHRHDLIEIRPGSPYGLQAIGRAGWAFLVIKNEVAT